MSTNNGVLALTLMLAACGSSAHPAANPATGAGGGAGGDAKPTALVTCYTGTGAVKLPDGKQVATLEALARRTLDPANSAIVEEFVNFGRKQERYVVTLRVDGSKFTMTEHNQAFTGTGELVGEPWHWTSWHSTSTLPDGTRVESTDEVTADGIRVQKSVHGPDGALQVTISEEFKTISAEACAQRFADVSSAVPASVEVAKPAAKEAPSAEVLAARRQLAEKMLAFFDEIIQAAAKNQDNCDAMAVDLKKAIERAKPLMAEAKEMEDKDPGSKDWFEENYGTALEQKMEQDLMPPLMKCADHQGVSEALQGLD